MHGRSKQKLKIKSKAGFCLLPLSAAEQMFRLLWQGLSLI